MFLSLSVRVPGRELEKRRSKAANVHVQYLFTILIFIPTLKTRNRVFTIFITSNHRQIGVNIIALMNKF